MRTFTLLLVLAAGLAEHTVLVAQALGTGQSGQRSLLTLSDEVALARSAAPPQVTDSADVWVLGPSGYYLAVQGSNGAACMVSRDWLASIEPICYDAEAAKSVMKVACVGSTSSMPGVASRRSIGSCRRICLRAGYGHHPAPPWHT